MPYSSGFTPPQGWFRALFPRSAWWFAALAAVLMVVSVAVAAGDARNEHGILSSFILPASVPTVWAVLQPIWTRYGEAPSILISLLRVMAVPILVAPIVAVAGGITVLTPPVVSRIASATSMHGMHYYFSDRDGSPFFQVFVLGGLANLFIAMLVGLVLAVFVVLPWFAFLRPREFSRANMYDTSDESAPANAFAGRMLSILLMLTFAVPALIIVGRQEARSRTLGELFVTWPGVFTDPERYFGDALWMLGIALIPLGIVALVLTKVLQRPDRVTRARYGVNADGDDPLP